MSDIQQLEPWNKPEPISKRVISAGWRLLTQYLIWWVLFSMVGIVFVVSPELWGDDKSLLLLREIAKLTTFTISVFLVVKLMDERDILSLGLKLDRWAFYDFLTGILITFIMLGCQFLLFLSLGWIQIVKFTWQSQTSSAIFWNIVGAFFTFAFVGWSEELLSRGFHLQTIERGLNKFGGVFLSSLIFAYLHRNNPGITLPSLIFIFFFGLLMSYACRKTGQLWLAIGLHTGWDFFVVSIFFGIPVGILKPFHLFDIAPVVGTRFIYYLFEFIIIIAIIPILNVYQKKRNSKIVHQTNLESSTP
jgi:uncharacterized protein